VKETGSLLSLASIPLGLQPKATNVVIALEFLQPDFDLLNVVANTTNHGDYSLGSDPVYLLETFEGNGVQLASQKVCEEHRRGLQG